MSSSEWIQNTSVASGALITLDLVKIVAHNIGKVDAGLLNTHTDCKVEWELLTADRLKASQCALDAGSEISKIIEIENKRNIQFECMYVRTKQGIEAIEDIYGKKVVLECDDKSKEERLEF